ncbi:PIN domain-containing protein [Sorangium sp. So ce406]|uniref:PIN domain-containing protein n=1 Tax=Sorangium sp. So ce406 TaxID=3133311 RepID=UPI003F5B3FF8
MLPSRTRTSGPSTRRTILSPIEPAVAALAARLPLHGDPADRLIEATASANGAELVTKDEQVRASGLVVTIW